MPAHSAQHFVPNSYLKAWCDPEAPSEQTPYVWRFSKNGSDARKKAPKNIFTETDLYTIKAADGSRDLTLEHGLSQLESEFATIREKVIAGEVLTSEEHTSLCVFTAATQARTKSQRDHHARQWGEVFEMMKSMKEQFESASAAEREQLARLSPSSQEGGPSLGFEDVKNIAEQPMTAMLGPMITAIAPQLHQLDMGLVETTDPQGFITSDRPCCWYDPELIRLPPFYREPNLASPTIEVTLPLTPHHLLLFNRRGFNQRFSAPSSVVDFYNRITRHYSDEFFVTSRNQTNPYWFAEEPLPEHAWEIGSAN